MRCRAHNVYEADEFFGVWRSEGARDGVEE
jgi:hypothetical protein